MLLHIIFLLFISITLTSQNTPVIFKNDFTPDEERVAFFGQVQQFNKKKDSFTDDEPSCDQLCSTVHSPFVVLLLLRTSGRFLGMGSIISRRTVLSASKAVERAVTKPSSLLIVAGRLSPWWGKASQVIHAVSIHQNDLEVAIVVLNHELDFNRNVMPIHLDRYPMIHNLPGFVGKFGKHWAVFGVPRSSWDTPGEKTSKSSFYVMRAETVVQKQDDFDTCKESYPEMFYNETHMVCSYANGTFCWGCIGSPTVSFDADEKLLQIGVLTRAQYTEVDEYHIHVKIGYFEQWIKSHAYMKI